MGLGASQQTWPGVSTHSGPTAVGQDTGYERTLCDGYLPDIMNGARGGPRAYPATCAESASPTGTGQPETQMYSRT